MSDGKEGLAVLEGLLNEFFLTNVSNQRKCEIESILTGFKNHPGSWSQCITYMKHTSNQYVVMFCLNTLEDVINKHWMGLQWEDRSLIKSYIYTYLIEKHQILPIFIRNKTIKLVVNVARLDWPHFYPDFFTNIIQLTENQMTCHLGLMFLLVISEELVSPREVLSFDRRNELKRLLTNLVPQIFNVLSGVLVNLDAFKHSEDCTVVLKAFSHYFTWVPAAQISVTVLDQIFKIAQDFRNEELAVLAICTLNEMLYRNWIPPNWGHFFNNSQTLLNKVLYFTQSSITISYIEKLCEFLHLVVRTHISRQQVQHCTILEQFLSPLLKFTVGQENLDPCFISCLSTWSMVLDSSIAARYTGILLSLAEEICKKIQFRLNHTQLEELDNQVLQNNEHTDWQKFLNTCIENVAKIAELDSDKVLLLVYDNWIELCNLFSQIQSAKLSEMHHNYHGVQCIVRDLCSFTQAMGRLYTFCTGDNWFDTNRFEMAKITIKNSILLSRLTESLQLDSMPDNLKMNFQHLHAQVLAALKSWCYWLPQLHDKETCQPLLTDVINDLLDICLTILLSKTEVPFVTQHAAVHLLLTLTGTVRPRQLWQFDNFKMLYFCDQNMFRKEDRCLIQSCVTNALILPWPKTDYNHQQWDERLKLLTSYLTDSCSTFLNLPLNYNQQHSCIIVDNLSTLSNVIAMYKCETSKTKKLLCLALQKLVERSLALFPVYARDGLANQTLLSFFLVLFECLQQEVGVNFTQIFVQSLMETYNKDNLEAAVINGTGGGLEQFFRLIDFIIQTPGLAASKLTPMAVTICLQLTGLIVKETTSPSIQESFFQLVQSLFLHKMSYFIKTNDEQRTQEFMFLMRSIGQSLLLSNINLFRQNLNNLEELNTKWRLFQKVTFQKELLGHFLSVLLDTLIARTHSLLEEEITVTIYNLVVVNVDGFYNEFLPFYLQNSQLLDDSQRKVLLTNFSKETDLPSLTQNVFRFVNDLNCYRHYNTSLPT